MSAAAWSLVAEVSELIGILLMAVPVLADFAIRKARGLVHREATTSDEAEIRKLLFESFTAALLAFKPWQRRTFALGLLGLVIAATIRIGVHLIG